MFRLLFLVFVVVDGRTVRYSNVPPHSALTTKTYDLAVPGSPPIRIIEAEPIWSTEDFTSTTPRYRDGLEHRSGKFKTSKDYTSTTTTTEATSTESEKQSVYSPDALNQFLHEYSDKIKADRKKFTQNEDTSEGSNESTEIKDDKSKTWGLVDIQHHNHPYEDQKGWVSMEAIPWSSSKISKWQSNHKYEPKPWSNNLNKPQNNWNNNYQNNQQNSYVTNNKYNSNKHSYYNSDSSYSSNNYFDTPTSAFEPDIRPGSNFQSKPSYQDVGHYSKPIYGFDQKPLHVKPEFSEWQLEMPSKPSWSKPSTNYNQWNKPVPDPWYHDKKPSSQFNYNPNTYNMNHNDHRDIITDGRPGNFPTPYSSSFDNYEPLKDRPGNSIHPATHPVNGNGEWVLLSTTKGYQYPRNKNQRSIEVTPDSIGARKGIRLTVLPPGNNTKVNMTTSHGGLLEVESTFESVEEAHKQFSERLKITNKTKLVNKIKKRPMKNSIATHLKPVTQTRPLQKPVPIITNKQDPTAVLAAVGAGLVPATMAMLVPFVSGRKRRSIANEPLLNKFNNLNVKHTNVNNTTGKKSNIKYKF